MPQKTGFTQKVSHSMELLNKLTGVQQSVSYDTFGSRKKENESNKIQLVDEGTMYNEKTKLIETQNMFFEDIIKRYEGVFGNYVKRSNRVKRTSM